VGRGQYGQQRPQLEALDKVHLSEVHHYLSGLISRCDKDK